MEWSFFKFEFCPDPHPSTHGVTHFAPSVSPNTLNKMEHTMRKDMKNHAGEGEAT